MGMIRDFLIRILISQYLFFIDHTSAGQGVKRKARQAQLDLWRHGKNEPPWIDLQSRPPPAT
jgi:hypothetical protein